MKKFVCKTKVAGLYEKGEVYKLDENERMTRNYIRLGYLQEVPMNYKKKEVDKK